MCSLGRLATRQKTTGKKPRAKTQTSMWRPRGLATQPHGRDERAKTQTSMWRPRSVSECMEIGGLGFHGTCERVDNDSSTGVYQRSDLERQTGACACLQTGSDIFEPMKSRSIAVGIGSSRRRRLFGWDASPATTTAIARVGCGTGLGGWRDHGRQCFGLRNSRQPPPYCLRRDRPDIVKTWSDEEVARPLVVCLPAAKNRRTAQFPIQSLVRSRLSAAGRRRIPSPTCHHGQRHRPQCGSLGGLGCGNWRARVSRHM